MEKKKASLANSAKNTKNKSSLKTPKKENKGGAKKTAKEKSKKEENPEIQNKQPEDQNNQEAAVPIIDINDVKEIQPSFLFLKDNNDNLKVVVQDPKTKEYDAQEPDKLKKGFVPLLINDKGFLKNFLENYQKTKDKSPIVETAKGILNKAAKTLIKGKLILVKSFNGLKKASEIANNFFDKTDKKLAQENKTEQTPKNTKYQETEINWKELEKIGISKDRLKITNQLENFLNGQRTSLIDPANIENGNKYFVEKNPFVLQIKDSNNKAEVHIIFKNEKLNIPEKFENNILTETDKVNLLTKYHLGRLLEINGKPCLVSVDKDLNTLCYRTAASIKIPDKITLSNGHEVEIILKQKNMLLQGKQVKVKNLMDAKNKSYEGVLLINAATGKLDVIREVPKIQQTKNQSAERSKTQKTTNLKENKEIKKTTLEKNNIQQNAKTLNQNTMKNKLQTEEKNIAYPLSQSVKNALTGAKITGYNPEKKQIAVKMIDNTIINIKVAEKTAEYLKGNVDMPVLSIKEVKNQNLQLGKTFIEVSPEAIKFLNSKFYEKKTQIPEKININKQEIVLSDQQRKDIGAGKPVNIGVIGEEKNQTFLMLNPNGENKLLILKADKITTEIKPQINKTENAQNLKTDKTVTADQTQKTQSVKPPRIKKETSKKSLGI